MRVNVLNIPEVRSSVKRQICIGQIAHHLEVTPGSYPQATWSFQQLRKVQISTVLKQIKDVQLVLSRFTAPSICSDMLKQSQVFGYTSKSTGSRHITHSVDCWRDAKAIGTCTCNIVNQSFSEDMSPYETEVDYDESICKIWLCGDRTCLRIAQEMLTCAMHTHSHKCTHAPRKCAPAYTRIHMHTHTHVYEYTIVCTHVSAHAHINTSIHKHSHTTF